MTTDESTLTNVLDALRGLGSSALLEVEKRVTFLRRTAPAATGAKDDGFSFARLVVEVIVEVLKEHAIPLPRTTANLSSRSDWQAFTDKIRVIERYLARSKRLNRTGKLAVLKLGVVYLMDRLAKEGRQVSFSVLLANVHRVPVLLNREFPGYAQAGVLHVLVTPYPRLTAAE